MLLLALLLRTTHASLARANAPKNVLLGVANTVAALLFAFLAPVDWAAVLPLGIGCLIGVPARADRGALRAGRGAAGADRRGRAGLAIRLGMQAYG